MRVSRVFDNTALYRLAQAPFVIDKLAPLLRRPDIGRARRVLDVGCGPGTNAPFFTHAEYLGLDLSPGYVEFARARFRGRFEVADATAFTLAGEAPFDFVLLNSLMHHLDDDQVRRVLDRVAPLVAPGGAVHVLDLVLPRRPGPAWALARLDRGEHPRPRERWLELLGERLEPLEVEPYAVGALGLPLWHMLYVRAGVRA